MTATERMAVVLIVSRIVITANRPSVQRKGIDGGADDYVAKPFRIDLLVPAAPRGQDEHRHGDPRVAPAAEQRQPVDFRQPEVEYDCVVLLRMVKKVGAFAVGGAVDGITRLAKGGLELPRQQRFVFDH